MDKKTLYIILAVSFCLGLLWFFTGRIQLGPILETTKAVRTEVESAKSFGSNVSEGHNRMGQTVAKLNKRSETIESGATGIVTRSEGSIERSKALEGGLEDLSISVRAGEKRYGLIVGVVGELRDITETFRETIESSNLEN